VRETAALVRTLRARLAPGGVLLVQTPPALPTLGVALALARARGARLVVDWHNFGWAMLGLRLGPRHPLVGVARGLERALGRRADAHLCVSRAMRDALAGWGIAGAAVLADRPAERFRPTPPAERAALVERLRAPLRLDGLGSRTALVVSPTSWTPDEDFALLLAAAREYDARAGEDAGALPELVVVLTGDGPLRAEFERQAAALRPRRIHLRTIWLEPEDYPPFLGAADLGLSLHRSASGVDLPMKVMDLLGAGVPVCALDYGPALAEQLRDGENGVLFATAAELASRLHALFRGFPEGAAELARLRRNVAAAEGPRWREAWTAVARPVICGGAA
jgi:beta-1,4-mannosyltransferase